MAKIVRKDAEKMLAEVPDAKAFWCCDGRTFKSLPELQKALARMANKTFAYHSSEGKSDFGNWVKDVFGDEKLARDLAKSPNRTRAAKSVTSRIAFLNGKLT